MPSGTFGEGLYPWAGIELAWRKICIYIYIGIRFFETGIRLFGKYGSYHDIPTLY